MPNIKVLFCLLFTFMLFACDDENAYIPKPRAFHRIELPPHEYIRYEGDYPYSFEFSKHAKMLKDTSFMAEHYWFEMIYPGLSASVHLTYKSIDRDEKKFEDYINDSHTLASKHNIKAYAIDEIIPNKQKPRYGTAFYEIEGDVPTSFQFVITDTTENFFRASLYVPTSLKNDSLAPVIRYVREDMMHLLNTFEWREIKNKKRGKINTEKK
jgi:gliding motility-associated lipoprotein GldD